MPDKNNQNRGVYFIIAVLVILVVIAILAVLFPNTFNLTGFRRRAGGRMLTVPTVHTTMRSADGQVYNINANFSLEIDPEVRQSVNASAVGSRITEVIAQLDYEELTSEYGADYLKEHVREGLREYIDPENLTAIYITDLRDSTDRLYAEPAPMERMVDRAIQGFKR